MLMLGGCWRLLAAAGGCWRLLRLLLLLLLLLLLTLLVLRFDPGFGYHVDNTRGIAKGNDPQSIYAVMSGSRHTGAGAAHKGCCFDCELFPTKEMTCR